MALGSNTYGTITADDVKSIERRVERDRHKLKSQTPAQVKRQLVKEGILLKDGTVRWLVDVNGHVVVKKKRK